MPSVPEHAVSALFLDGPLDGQIRHLSSADIEYLAPVDRASAFEPPHVAVYCLTFLQAGGGRTTCRYDFVEIRPLYEGRSFDSSL